MITRSNTYLTTPNGARIRASSATLEMSEDWSPYIRARVTLPAAISGALEGYDPRTAPGVFRLDCFRHGGSPGNSQAAQTARALVGGKVKVATLTALGAKKTNYFSALAPAYDTPQTPTQHLTTQLVVDEASHDMKNGTYALSLVSRELLLQDFVLTAEKEIAASSLTYALMQVLSIADQPTLILDPVTTTVANFRWESGESAWEMIEKLTTDLGYRLIGDLSGAWRLVKRNSLLGTTHAVAPEQLLGLTRTLSRKDWHDYVYVTSRSERFGVTSEFSSRAGVYPGTKALVLDRGLNPPVENQYAATELLDRHQRRGDVYTLVSPLDLKYQPLDALTINSKTYRCVSVEHDLTDHTTTLTTREG